MTDDQLRRPPLNVFWDLGGTLVDTYPQLNRTFADVVAAHDSAVEIAEVAELTNRSTSEAIRTLANKFSIAAEEFSKANEALKLRWESQPAPAAAGAKEVLDAVFRRGGLNLVVTHRDRRSAEALLSALGLVVDDLICPEDGYPRKPDPSMHLELVRRHRLAPQNCLSVGDRPIDAAAAMSAGIEALTLTSSGPATGQSLSSLAALIPTLEARGQA